MGEIIDVRDEASRINELFYQRIPAMGLRNYWHPVARSRDVDERGRSLTVMGDPVLLLRRNGTVYAVADECPHRGSRLGKGRCEFPGSNTVTCRYHGWTFDVTDGRLVAVLTDGPDAPLAGKLRVRTYPVEERQGIVWIWMADEAPVPVEEDVPRGLLSAQEVHCVVRHVYGNWRWHAENPGLGHATMLHRDSLYMQPVDMFGYAGDPYVELGTEGEDGEWLLDKFRTMGEDRHYPGLGEWPRRRPWQLVRLTKFLQGPLGVDTIVSIRLPGVVRVSNFPIARTLYYEWFVQTDADHYLYFQTACAHPGEGLLERLAWKAKFFLWGRPAGMVRFNAQDLWMVEDSHDYAKRHGHNDPAPRFRPDGFQVAWRWLAVTRLRGGGVRPEELAPQRAAHSSAA